MHRLAVPVAVLAVSVLLLALLGGRRRERFAASAAPAGAPDADLFPYKNDVCHPSCCAQNPLMSCSRGCLCCRKPAST